MWYAFGLEGQRLFFSGDYTEHSPVYAVDPVRGQTARLAVLDSAYGPDPRSDGAMRQDFLDAVSPWASAGQPVLFPVPKYGRGSGDAFAAARPLAANAAFMAMRTSASKRRCWPQTKPGCALKPAPRCMRYRCFPWERRRLPMGSAF